MTPGLGPREELLRHLVPFEAELDRFIEVIQLEMDAADNIRRSRHPEFVAGGRGIVAHPLVPTQGLLVVAFREVDVSEEERAVSEEEPLMSLLRELDSSPEVRHR